jgi:membrane protein DedA with SNARE-associated domain
VYVGIEQYALQMLSAFAYHPLELYGLIIIFMTLSSFGLPIPEEVVLISSGLIAYAGTRPDLFPPPYPGALVVDPFVLAAVCFFGVFLSDLLVFAIGKFFGKQLAARGFFTSWLDTTKNPKLSSIREKYGVWACGIFRFTPALRFPGHMSCGALGVPYWKFVAIDGTAALISVPTQVILVALYGELMLAYLKQFKMIFLSVVAIAAVAYVGYRLYQWAKTRQTALAPQLAGAVPLTLVHSAKPQQLAERAAQEEPQITNKAG